MVCVFLPLTYRYDRLITRAVEAKLKSLRSNLGALELDSTVLSVYDKVSSWNAENSEAPPVQDQISDDPSDINSENGFNYTDALRFLMGGQKFEVLQSKIQMTLLFNS